MQCPLWNLIFLCTSRLSLPAICHVDREPQPLPHRLDMASSLFTITPPLCTVVVYTTLLHNIVTLPFLLSLLFLSQDFPHRWSGCIEPLQLHSHVSFLYDGDNNVMHLTLHVLVDRLSSLGQLRHQYNSDCNPSTKRLPDR
jgi:hypothetical protein